ncbi:hypothetical protein [Streptomyces sp. NPDC059783]|uniref:hypothetical protein n=1 Tax=Streptomyces sp. NPDC059783 TaxID=3346944 RepID=UPI003650D83B
MRTGYTVNGADTIRYARVHRCGAILAGAAVVALLSAFFGGAPIALPSIGSGGLTTGVPYRQELPLLSAVFLAAALDGPMAAHEEAGASRMHRTRNEYCAAMTAVVCAFSFLTETLAVDAGAGTVFVRSLLIWFGLALLSARLLGQQLAWSVPLASVLLLIWYPLAWWDWTAAPASDPISWAVAAVALATGVVASGATAWRRKSFLGGKARLPQR